MRPSPCNNVNRRLAARESPVPTAIGQAILEQSLPSSSKDGNQCVQSHVVATIFQPNPISHTEAKASAVNPLARLEASALADNLSSAPLFHNMSMSGETMFPSKQVIRIPLSSRNNTPIKVCPTSKQSGQLVTSTSIGMNLEVYQNIPLLQKKLQNSFVRNLTMSEGKDSIVKVVLDDSTSNAMKILDVAKQETLHGAEGYS